MHRRRNLPSKLLRTSSGLQLPQHRLIVGCASGEPNTGGSWTYSSKLVYLIDERQLTKDYQGSQLVIIKGGENSRSKQGRGKPFSQCRSEFPFGLSGRPAEKWPEELHGDQVVTLAMLRPQYLGAQVTGDGWQ